MLQQISWGDYITWVLILAACYYILVAIFFYRGEIRTLINSRRHGTPASTPPVTSSLSPSGDTVDFEDLENTINDINSILSEAGQEAGKEQLLGQLQQRLANCDGLRHPAYRVAVFNHIIQQAEKICGVRIDKQDLEQGVAAME